MNVARTALDAARGTALPSADVSRRNHFTYFDVLRAAINRIEEFRVEYGIVVFLLTITFWAVLAYGLVLVLI